MEKNIDNYQVYLFILLVGVFILNIFFNLSLLLISEEKNVSWYEKIFLFDNFDISAEGNPLIKIKNCSFVWNNKELYTTQITMYWVLHTTGSNNICNLIRKKIGLAICCKT